MLCQHVEQVKEHESGYGKMLLSKQELIDISQGDEIAIHLKHPGGLTVVVINDEQQQEFVVHHLDDPDNPSHAKIFTIPYSAVACLT